MPTGIYKRSKKHLEALHRGGRKTRFQKGHFVPQEWKEKFKKYRLDTSYGFNWKGGKTIDGQGYVHIWNPNHPFANYSQHHYVKRCILVMEKKMGRPLNKKEVVHHINRIKNDDRPENLYLFPSERVHQSYESNNRWMTKRWKLNSQKLYQQ